MVSLEEIPKKDAYNKEKSLRIGFANYLIMKGNV